MNRISAQRPVRNTSGSGRSGSVAVTFMDVLYIVIPAYNEEDNIRAVIDAWYPIIETHPGNGKSRLVFINDGSRDRTGEILREQKNSRPLLTVLCKSNGGHGPAVMLGYRYALSRHADYIFQTDSDGQTDSADFELFWKHRKRYDAIFGNRTRREDGASRIWIERILCLILKLYFGVSVPDANAPFRLMTAAYLREFLPKLPPDYVLPNALLTVMGVCTGRKTSFHEISFRPRRKGRNSVNYRRIFSIAVQALRGFGTIRARMR